MKVIGVCGKSGSGKSTYARKLSRDTKSLLVDVDKIVHELLEVERIRLAIAELVKVDSSFTRKELGNALFSDKQLMNAYNEMLYKEIKLVLDRLLSAAESGGVDVILDWALLPMTKYYDMCTEKHLIKKSLDDRKKSVLKRDDITEEYFQKRENNALQYDEAKFDKVIEMEFKNKGFLAGTFDPLTMGHLDIAMQARKDFDEVIIGIAINPEKRRRFDKDSMQHAILQAARDYNLDNIDCVVYPGFTGEKALELECYTLIRGSRNDTDMAYEKPIADFNKQRFGLDTVYYSPPQHLQDVSSSKIKEMMRNGQSIEGLVPKAVYELVH
ncbi:MAG: pantetheine-phosphate adenylyltransferase [Firmicutes bacterium]|nr:pantetheine-phosphate adenylyltransferase [Bacillota bacterium]